MPLYRLPPSVRRAVMCAALGWAATSAAAAQIYTCIDANGKRHTSDRPIAVCNDREQQELNPDGSLRRRVPPTPTADERTEIEARQQKEALERANRVEAMRRDRNLLARFPNEGAHQKAREAALEDARTSLKISEQRLAALQKERKPLLDEAEFYVGKPLPGKLKLQLDGNEAATDAQKTLILNLESELVRINENYDAELERLRKLWAGAQPGSLGALPKVASPSASPPLRRPAP